MRGHRSLTVLASLGACATLATLLGGAICGVNEVYRHRIRGDVVDAPAEDAGVPEDPAGFLPRRHSSGDRYHRTDVVTLTEGEHASALRVEREVIVESVGTDGAILMSERVKEVHLSADGREGTLPREERDCESAVARYRVNLHGALLGEVEVVGGTPENMPWIHDIVTRGLTQGVFDRGRDMRPTDHRAAERTIPLDLDDVRPDLHLSITYTLRSVDEREARLELDGSGEVAETPLPGRGHNKLHGSANMTGAMSVDPRDGFAGTYRDELHVFYTVRDEQNRPRGPAVNLIYVTETTISRAP